MIGDSDIDFMTAKAAGVPDGDGEFRLRRRPAPPSAPEAVIDHFDELQRACVSLLARR